MRTSLIYLLFFTLFHLCATSLPAQSWKNFSKQADQLANSGKHFLAASLYQKAYKAKSSKTELLKKAATSFYQAGAYQAAIPLLDKALTKSSDTQLIYLLAQSLKGLGNYSQAIPHYKKVLEDTHFTGVSKEQIAVELKGAEMAKNNMLDDNSIQIIPLSTAINSEANEEAPLPFASGILYFSSDKEGEKRIFRSRLSKGQWSEAIPANLPKVEGIISQGTFNKTGDRFYFTLCDKPNQNCDIWVTQKKDKAWTKAEKLRDYIKMSGSKAMHPFVMNTEKEEMLYFSSDRNDGKGGMDIWFTSRPLSSEVFDFSFPINVGSEVNTPQDELFPFFDQQEGKLFFSSNGHVGLGGYDLYTSKKVGSNFQTAEHLKSPINSSYDELSFISKDGIVYISSKRPLMEQEDIAPNTNIFRVMPAREDLKFKGTLSNLPAGSTYKAALYEVDNFGKQKLLIAKNFKEQDFEFELLADKKLKVQVVLAGHQLTEYSFDSQTSSDLSHTFTLQRSNMEKPVYQAPRIVKNTPTSKPIHSSPHISSSSSSSTVTSPSTSVPSNAENKVYGGVYYKVQVTAEFTYDPKQGKYDPLKQYGNIDTEYLADKGLIRILISPFFSLSEARQVVATVRDLGYADAFPVRYKDGRRMTP